MSVSLKDEYRGKVYPNGGWVYGSLLIDYYGKPNIWTPYEDPRGPRDDRVFGDLKLVDEETVGQCVGFRDKNDKKIFDGDFIRISDSDAIVLVAIHDGQAVCVRDKYYMHRFSKECTYEVVGNVHDSPEMLRLGEENSVRKELKVIVINGEAYAVPITVADYIDNLKREIQDLHKEMYDVQTRNNFLESED